MIMSQYFSFLPVLLSIQLSIHFTTCKPFFVLMAPNILRAGNEETIVIQCHECEKHQTVDINVNTFQDKLMYRTVVNLHESNNFLATAYINIPPSFLSSDITEKQYVVVQATSKEITLKRVILLSPDTGHIFIQTSKTIYTPKQNVNYRIFSTDKNLDPTERDVVILLENPEGIIVNKDTRKIKNGISAFTMKIPELVTFGMWKLVAKFENTPQREYTTQFEVREYVLPTFSVELDTKKKFFYYKDDKLVVNIKANYLFGENVNGYAVAIFGLYKDFLKILHGSMQREQIVKGEGQVTLTREQLLEGVSDENELLGVSIYVNVTVFSSEGDYVQVHKTNIKIVSSPYNIAITRTPTYFKPGMPLKIMVLVTNPDMTPAVQIPVACGKELGFTSEEGLAHITVNTQGSDKDLEITVRTAEKDLPDDQQASVTLKATAYISPYQNYLHIDANLDGNVVKISLYSSNQDKDDKGRIKYFTILVISRGKILLTKVQKRTASEAITSLRITLTPEMLPSFRIVAYYYLVYLNSLLDIVSDSIWLHMKRTCKSNLQINPPKISLTSYEPENKVELTLTGDQGSQVGLVVVDKAVFVLNNKGRFTQDKIWDEVQEDDLGCSAGSGENALGVFEDAGLDFGTTMKLGTPSRKDFTCTTKLHNRKRRSYELLAAKQKKAIESPAHLRPCCLAGLHESPMGLDCTARKKHVQEQECADLFFECCIHAEKLREQLSKDLEWERSDGDEEDVPEEASPRSFFPESWFWQIYELKNPKSDQKSSTVTMPLTLNLPSSITTWIVQAVSIKKNQGICVSNAYPLTVSMKLFVDLRMPYSVRRNEQVQIRAVVHNYLGNRRKVTVKFPYIENVCSLATKSRGYQVQVEVEAQSTKVVNYVIIPLKIETIHIEVQVSSSGISDKVKKSIDVLPEGKLERKKTFSQAVNPEGRSELLYVRKEELDGIVPDTTASYFISVQGDIMGESLLGILDESYLGRLLNIPSGCPEQNMFKTSTNVIATRYLDANKKWGIVGAEKRLKAIDNIGQGYIQQLAHHLPDHSFQKSTWLTAYVVKIFAMAYSLVGINEHMLCNSLKWLATKQNPSGEFIESGEVYTKSMQGGYIESESSSSLTAFVLIALAEAEERCDIKEVQDAMQKAKKYLEKNLLSLKQTYSAVITSYALALVGSTENEDFIDRFADKTGTVWVVEKSVYYTVEATGYALLQKLKRGKYEQAQKIANWLVGVRSFGGGYASTQATVVALQALTQYKTDVGTDADVNLNVKLVVEGRANPVEYTIINNDAYLERTEKIPGNRDLNFTITGHGECTVTVMTVYYSLLTSEKKCNGFMLQAEVTADERKAGTYILKMQIRYNDSVPATMTLIEITMLTGFTPNIEDLKRLSSKVENYIMTYETQESTSNASVVLYLTKVPHNETLSIGFRIHQTTEVGLLQPADISIYEYYDLDKKCSTFYNLPDESWQLRKLCKGSACKCATGACASLVKGSEELKEKACSEGIDFVFRVRLTKTVRESSYDYNDVTIVDIIKDAESNIKTRIVGATMKLVSHMACDESLNLQINSEYLIMNHYSDLWEVSPLTSFVLSSKTFIFDWSEGDETLTEFASDMKVQGCST